MLSNEEKAEELVKENVCKKCGSKVCGFLIRKCDIALPRYEGVLIGLEEGRMSTIEAYTQVDRATIFSVETLEKELAESRIELEIKEGFIKYWKKLCKDKSNDVIELQKENAELKVRVDSLICNLIDIQNKIDEIVTTPKIMQKEENELLCELIKKICEYTRSN